MKLLSYDKNNWNCKEGEILFKHGFFNSLWRIKKF
jgi:hypothetical protein